jgi:hypothetical protein
LPAHIAGKGFGKSLYLRGAQTVCDTKDGREIDVMNHWTVPDRVKTVGLEVESDTLVLPALSVTAVECEIGE